MKIVNIIGGLGNQMFQYAFAIALKCEFPQEDIKLNVSCFNGYKLHNGYELEDIFNVNLPKASFSDLIKTAYPWIHYRLWQLGKKLLPSRKTMIWTPEDVENFDFSLVGNKWYFDGYWQSPCFFETHRNTVVRALQFPKFKEKKNIKLMTCLSTKSYAFLHIRRGDYVNHPLYQGICSIDYYKNGISILKNKGFKHFLIFSNDMDWCRVNISYLLEECEVKYVDWNKDRSSFRDIQLMSLCKGAVIANSSFSWWGAWLGELETVIAPEHWTNPPYTQDAIYPSNWIRLSN